jgi:hypothetical protein
MGTGTSGASNNSGAGVGMGMVKPQTMGQDKRILSAAEEKEATALLHEETKAGRYGWMIAWVRS